MIVLGIDQSYNSSGIVVLDDDKIIHCECFKSNKELNRFGQAHQIALHIGAIYDKFNPKLVGIEGLPFAMRGNVTRDLAGLLFVIVANIQENKGKEVGIFAPTAVKKSATGNGKADKQMMIEALPAYALDKFLALGVKKTTGLSDLADSFAIAQITARQHKENYNDNL